MESDIIDRMRREEADLARKLDAVRALLSAYGQPPIVSQGIPPAGFVAPVSLISSATEKVAASSPRSGEKLPLGRFGAYGQSVIKAAIEECYSHLGGPIPSKVMVDLVERRGITVTGTDKANALSSLLARSADLKPNGRKGWTLADDFDWAQYTLGVRDKDNEPHSVSAGGSYTGNADAPTSAFHGINL